MQIQSTFTADNSDQLHYLLHVPEGNSESGYPMLMFLHGMGERGNDLSQLFVHGIPKIVQQDANFPFVTVSPQCLVETVWPQNEILKGLWDHVIMTQPVDPSRVYLTGLSMGGHGSWALATAYPNSFAAVAPICGRGDPAQAHRIKKLPLWVFHGDADNIVPIDGSKNVVMALKDLGSDVNFTIYPDTGHDSWTITYDNPQLYEWFLQHRLPGQ